MLASSAVDRGFESRSGQTKKYQLVCVAYNANHAELIEKEQRPVDSESGQCVQVERDVYPRTVDSVS